jgi:branched-chain amino acid transport system permease protein
LVLLFRPEGLIPSAAPPPATAPTSPLASQSIAFDATGQGGASLARKLNIRWWAVGGSTALVATLLVTDRYAISQINLIAIAVLIAASLRFGMLIGEVSFATAAFVGFGAYGAGVATTILKLPLLVAMLVGPLLVVLVSILFGMVTLRIKGPYFMLIGFAFAEAVRIALGKISAIGGVSGMGNIFPPRFLDPWLSTIIVGVVIAMLFALYVIEKTDFGKVLGAIRDNENIARTVGLDVLNLKVTCFAIASFCAGVAGSLHAFANSVISPGDFSFLIAVYALAYVKIGGESSIFGAILGTIILVLISSFALSLGTAEQFIYGGAISLAMLFLPQGVIGLPWRRLLPRRSADRPARLADTIAR